jgi:tetratricopeptide (TPR) repeat protein
MGKRESRAHSKLLQLAWVLAVLLVPASYGQGQDQKGAGEFRRALSSFESGDYPGALEILLALENTNPVSFDVEHLLAIVLDLAGKPEEANQRFKKAVALNPGSAAAHANLGTNLVRVGKTEAAVAEFLRALKIDPGNATANFNLGTMFLRQKKYHDALPRLEKAYRVQPKVYENGYHLALCLFLAGDHARAQAVLDSLQPVPPHRAEFYLILAMNQKALGKGDEAQKNLQEILPALSARPELHEQVSMLLFSQGMFREAIPILEEAVSRLPAAQAPLAVLAQAELQTGALEKARNHAEQALALKESADLHLLLADVLEASSRPIEAVEHYRQAVNLDPSERNFIALGYEFLSHWNWKEAQDVFEYALPRIKGSWRLRIGLGVACLGQNDAEKATRHFLQAIELAPAEPHGYELLAESFGDATDSFDAAVARFQGYYRASPANALAAYYRVLAAQRRSLRDGSPLPIPENIEILEKMIAQKPDFYPAHYLMGEIYSARQNWPRAIAAYERAAALDRQSFEVHYKLGMNLQRLGQAERAQAELKLYQELKEKKNEAMAEKIAHTAKFIVEPAREKD